MSRPALRLAVAALAGATAVLLVLALVRRARGQAAVGGDDGGAPAARDLSAQLWGGAASGIGDPDLLGAED